MARSLSLSGFFEDGKYPKPVLAAGAILLQLGIFVALYNQSGLKSRISILDSEGRKVYESPGAVLGTYEKMVFEDNFGPLRNYTTQIDSQQVPFNYRAWVLLAVRMPLGLILMLFFMAQVWLILLNGSPKEEIAEETDLSKIRFSTFLSTWKNFSIPGVGFIIFMSMLTLWLIPSILSDMATSFFSGIKGYPWFFMGVFAFVGGVPVRVVYLRYRLSRQMPDNQMEIEKYRIRTHMIERNPVPHLLTAHADAEVTRGQFLQPGER